MAGQVYQSFSSLPYERADLAEIDQKLRRARLRSRLAMKPESAVRAVFDAQQALLQYHQASTLARIRHDQKTSDPYYLAERDFYDQADPKVDQMKQAFFHAMRASRFQKEITERFGGHIFRKAVNMEQIIQPIIMQDLVRENKLISQYEQLMSEAAADFGDKTYSFEQLSVFLESSDRQTRKDAWQARSAWLIRHQERLDEIYDQLVRLRTRMSNKLHFNHFTDVGYRRMERFDYGPEQVAAVRDAVKRYIVPMTKEIRRLQKKRLNVDSLYTYDWPCLFREGNPQTVCDKQDVPLLAAHAMADLTGRHPSLLAQMLELGYVDLYARRHKTPGAYCEMFYEPGLPFIMQNASGTADDVFVLMHEAGHAYAAISSLPKMSLIDCHMPSLDICEIHSTAFEYLSYPYMERFFGQMAEQVCLMHLTQALLFLPYGCMVDEFQHQVYAQPEMGTAQRHKLWRELEAIYQPDTLYDQDPFFEKGGAWQLKGHIYSDPFYYIDYVLAQLVALDLWQKSLIDPGEAFRYYDKLCQLGGCHTLSESLEIAGLPSPFNPATLKKLAYTACDFLSL